MAYDNAIPSYESILEFQEVYLRAIALVWSDEYENGDDSTMRAEFMADPIRFLQEKFAYNSPWNVDLRVEDMSEGSKKKKASKWVSGKGNAPGHWKNLAKNRVEFGWPKKPDGKYAGSEPLALAAYNDSGPTYLFTCC
ncbi:MAG: BMA_0021/BMA_0022 family TOMM bacteriocin [Marinobacterium sp.]|nr:BMA_0021/BMA_0022 family TOMM bacteriocin [Marinobacterium sp.]